MQHTFYEQLETLYASITSSTIPTISNTSIITIITMKASFILSLFFLASAVSATDKDYKQMCYETCVHKNCNGSNTSNLCTPNYVRTFLHVDYRPQGQGKVPNAVHASICVMAPSGVTTFNRDDYECERS
ncbi:hypothetical protein K457DRAFT_19220 [Linnemannia elongata AG-77]|uniref:Uncharacterized protein n=1 Tax=Linnemannia elongata AG-77 TaxID=1314771 RepID=A0A197JW21_9FUNG|nr:hypothetical protein K457DRAFT_19220 [Linnemannia elongata AG-77]